MLFLSFLLLFQDIQFRDLKQRVVELHALSDFATVEAAIKLETTDQSLIGSVKQVLWDKNRDLLYVGDFESTRSIFVFNSQGRFLRTLSRVGDGPGELKGKLQDLALRNDGSVVVLTSKHLHVFDAKGVWLKDVKLDPFRGTDVVALGDQTYVEATHYASIVEAEPKRVSLYNASFDLQTRFGAYESRRDLYSYRIHESIQALGDQLWVLDFYQPTINIFGPNGSLKNRLLFPQHNHDALEKLWTSKNFTENTRTEIRDLMHRFVVMYPYGDQMLVMDAVNTPIPNMQMFSISKTYQVTVYKGYHPLNPEHRAQQLGINWFVGSSGSSLIGVIEPDEHFFRHQTSDPILKKVQIEADGNPLLVIMRPKH